MEPRTTDQGQAEVEATLSTIESSGGLLGIEPSAASRNVASWASRTRAAGLSDVADDLDSLESELNKSAIDGRAVGALLTRLGTGTTQAASGASPMLSKSLSRLGEMLRAAGQQLAG